MAPITPSQTSPTPVQPPIVVKKYANRRLYNTSSSSYVTLEELAQLLREGRDFVVFDAKSGEEITRSVLTQIILEEDSKGRNLLPVGFLRRLIGYYDDGPQAFLPRYLEMSMEHFIQNQEQMQRYFEGAMGRFFPVSPLNDMTRQNMAFLQHAAAMFRPFPVSKDDKEAAEQVDQREREIAELRSQVEALQAALAAASDSQDDGDEGKVRRSS